MLCWILPYNNVNQPYVYICALRLEPPSPTPFHPSGSSQSTKLSSLCYKEVSCKLSILHMVAYTHQSPSPNLSHPPLTSLCPQVHSVSLCLYSCPMNRFISTIVSRFHIYSITYDICFTLSDLDWLTPLWSWEV